LFLLITGLLFAAGWTVFRGFFRVNQEHRAVVWTKFSGLKEKLYTSGLYFFPERAVPGYFKAKFYPVMESPLTEMIEIDLPMRNELIHIGSFFIKYRIKLTFGFTEKALKDLFSDDSYEQEKKKIRTSLLESEKTYLMTRVIHNILRETQELTADKLFKALNEFTITYLRTHHKNVLSHISVSYHPVHFPDIELYKKHAAAFAVYFEQQAAEYIRKMAQLKYEKRYNAAVTEMEIDRLKKYAELFKKDKNILNYLFLQKISDKIQLAIIPSGNAGLNIQDFFSYLRNRERSQIVQTQNRPQQPVPAAPQRGAQVPQTQR